MKKRSLPWFAALLLGTAPGTVLATGIVGNTGGSTAGPLFGIDDYNIATTFQVNYVTFDAGLLNALTAAGFDASMFEFAGMGDAMNIPNIPASDFDISDYFPWVVNNNPTTNNLPFPSGLNGNRGVTQQDAGGADFLMFYTPMLPTDPTTINFIQVINENDNGMGTGQEDLDNFRSTTSPYYNQGGHQAGVLGGPFGVPNLVIPAKGSAWLGDIPYACENGTAVQRNFGANCSGGMDETILSQSRTFETYIEADTVINGRPVHLLYGGVQWGYLYTNSDLPEPSSGLLFGIGMVAIGAWGYRRRRGSEVLGNPAFGSCRICNGGVADC